MLCFNLYILPLTGAYQNYGQVASAFGTSTTTPAYAGTVGRLVSSLH